MDRTVMAPAPRRHLAAVAIAGLMLLGPGNGRAADVIVGVPPANLALGQQFDVEIAFEMGSDVLGSYFLKLLYDPAVLEVVAVAGGGTSEFSGLPTTDVTTFTSGATPIAAAQGNGIAPTGRVSVAFVTFDAIGPAGAVSVIDPSMIQLFSGSGDPIVPSLFGSLALLGFDPAADDDLDGLTNQQEFDAGTFFDDNDSDDDGLLDGFEVAGGLDARDDGSVDPAQGPNGDPDGDGLTNAQEQALATNPTSSDTDGDGLDDGFESTACHSPTVSDHDADLLPDGYELANLLDPCDDGSVNPDNGGQGDPDGDNDPNVTEFLIGSDPQDFRSRAVDVDLALAPRFQLLFHPLEQVAGFAAFDLLALLPVGTVVSSIENGENTVESPVNFLLPDGAGVIVDTATGAQVTFTGPVVCPTIDLVIGVNITGLRCLPPGYSAFAWLQDLGNSTEVSGIQRFDLATGRFETALYDSSGQPAGSDFPLLEGEAYLVHMLVDLPSFDPLAP